MAMNGIDVSSYQATLDLSAISYDFVAIKATQGKNYVNPYCDAQFQKAKAQGKKIAIYHYANGNDAIEEAEWFVNNCIGYAHEAIFVLDWEGTGVQFTAWALKFLQHVEARIGYKPAIYMSEYVVNTYDWSAVVAGDYGLWAAKYSDYEIDNNYDISHAGQPPNVKWWLFYFMWQWTSKGHLNGYAGDLDCDLAYLSPAQWDKYAGVVPPAPPAPEPTTTTTTEAPPPPVTTTTTTVEPTTTTTTVASPLPPVDPVQPPPSTTTTTTLDLEPMSWWAVLIEVIKWFLGRK